MTKLQQKIETLQKALEADNKEKDQAVYKLKEVEKGIARHLGKLQNIDRQLQIQQAKLDTLMEQQHGMERQMSTLRDYLIKQIQAAYAMGNQEYMKLLLNQQNPSEIARMVVYYQYFNASRTERLNEINHNLLELRNVSDQILRKTSELKALKLEAEENQLSLETIQEQRRQLVANLSARLRDKNQALQQLLHDEQHLKRLLNQLENELKDIQLDLTPPKEFVLQKGSLPWPTEGKITARFGSSRQAGDLKWQGVMIQTEAGDAIRAIAYGRVIFADWLRGFGMLIIVDHGKGYMSLYGHNQQLHKKPGDWVQGKEIIASTGDSGGQKTNSLYFEIRHNGVPQNPDKWCKSLPFNS
ncbi:MAG: peptidoglycan DD-metalloendopeptidase family protein [Gammaproteobacteria bacterium]|nr:peptidoglycan DD-metalloendopeptidase family protein [Gammaproteobacteria bacterium]